MSDPKVLLVSHDSALVERIREISRSVAHLGFLALDGLDDAFGYGGWDRVGLVLIHQVDRRTSMPVARLLRMIAAARRPVATLVLADKYNADQALELLRLGVAEYLGLPIDPNRLTHLIDILTIRCRKAVGGDGWPGDRGEGPGAAAAERGKADSPGSSAAGLPAADSTVLDGDSPQIANLIDQIRRVAPHNATVLLGGEIGTGKKRLARQIHALSDRRDEPFLTVDCGTGSHALFEGELFGYVRGAFPGVTAERAGKFAEVGRGTLFLDGVDVLPLPIQAKVLRAVEARAFEPIGATQALPLLARLIASSHRPLDEEVAERRFRSDLYYRLNVVGFELPPLRERRDAIAALTEQFLAEFAAHAGRDLAPITDEALQALREHDWPGNISELRDVVARCAAACGDRSIRREDLPPSVLAGLSRPPAAMPPVHPILMATFNRSSQAVTEGQAEYARITQALQKHNNNRLRAALELGISRMTLYKRLHKYGLMKPSEAKSHA